MTSFTWLAVLQLATSTAFPCGLVGTVTCAGPGHGASLQLSSAGGVTIWWIDIPAESRPLFGPRLEERYEQQLVCLAPPAPSRYRQRVVVKAPAQIVTKETRAVTPLPDDVARSCDPDVVPATLIKDVKPKMTADAMKVKVNGSVFLQGIVDRDGRMREVRVVQSLLPSLDAEASNALAQWQFRPATRKGEPVAIAMSFQMAFSTR